MNRTHLTALLFSLLGFLVTALITDQIFDAVPHLEDEIAYVWQAEVIARGHLAIPSPPEPKSFLVPFVVDHEGLRFGKYPPGWPAVLAAGVLLNLRWLVNPLLAGLGIWLTFLLGKRLFGEVVGLLSAALTLASPFFLLNSGSLLSHPLGLVLTVGFALAWLDNLAERSAPRRWRLTLLAGFLLGFMILTRPFTAVGVAVPFALHGAYLFFFSKEDPPWRWQTRLHLAGAALLILALGSLLFAWQYAVTGDPFVNPYTLWWPYDKVGFGPGYGVSDQGHNLRLAWINTKHSLESGYKDLFGWGDFSWILLPFGVLAAARRWKALLVGSIFPVLVILYMAYWVGSSLFGPRYYYEGLVSLTIFSAAGIAWLAGWLDLGLQRVEEDPSSDRSASQRRLDALRPWLVGGLTLLLVGYNIFFYVPTRLNGMRGLYQISRANYEPFQTRQAQELTPALFIVHTPKWMAYGALIELEDPWLTTPFIFAWSRGPRSDAALVELFPDRTVYHYYPQEPFVFYKVRLE